LLPCILGSKLKDITPSKGDAVQPKASRSNRSGDGVNEVNSPTKEPVRRNKKKVVNADLARVSIPHDNNALLCLAQEASEF
jgi:hypothetical protein